jgi:4-alpha-glucanotransferase
MAIGLISDLAVGADPAGSQAWSRQDQMLNGLSVGAPPDVLAPLGQNWGLGAFSPVALSRHGFQAYLEMLRSAFRHAGGVRIDHVLGLSRMWLTPDGLSANEGAYLRFPFDDLLRLIALESWRHRGIVIGEDLGPGRHTRHPRAVVPAPRQPLPAALGLVQGRDGDHHHARPADRGRLVEGA